LSPIIPAFPQTLTTLVRTPLPHHCRGMLPEAKKTLMQALDMPQK